MGKLIQGVNDLYTWCMENGEYGQQLISEWTGEYIDDICDEYIYKMTEVSRASGKKMLWKCSKGHEWYATIHDRTGKKSLCKICSKKNVSKKMQTKLLLENLNNLYTWSKENNESIINEWTGFDDENNIIDIHKVNKGSHKRMLWKCTRGHEWYAEIRTRVHGSNCPYCYNMIKSKVLTESLIKRGKNDLYTWCINNSKIGRLIINEWTGICEDGNHYEITDITRGSHKKMLWKCTKEHKWYASIHSRTNFHGCPYCNNKSTSYPEQLLYRALKQIYPQTISRGKFQGIEYDITIPEERTCIEYSGAIWHSDKLERDQLKADLCKQYNVRFIQIIANRDDCDTYFDDNVIVYKPDFVHNEIHDKQLVTILDYIVKSFNHSINEIDIEKAQTEAFNFMHDIDNDEDNE